MFNLDEELPPVRAGHVSMLLGIAAIIVLLAIGAYVYWGRVPPSTQGKILDLNAYQPHLIVDAKTDASESSAQTQANLPLLVLANVRIENLSQKPLSIFELSGILTLDGEQYRSLDVSDVDFARVFQHYPELSLQEQAHIPHQAVIEPGAARQGLLIFHYPISLDQWKQRKSFHVTVSFGNEIELVLADASPAPSVHAVE